MTATVTDLQATKARMRLVAERMMRLRVAMKDVERDDAACENFSFDRWHSCAAGVICRRQEFIDEGLTMVKIGPAERPMYRKDGVDYLGFGALQQFFDLTMDQMLTIFAGPMKRPPARAYSKAGTSVDESPPSADLRSGRAAVVAVIEKIDAYIGRPLPETFTKVLAGG